MPNTRKDTQNRHRSPHQATTSTPRKICECVEANATIIGGNGGTRCRTRGASGTVRVELVMGFLTLALRGGFAVYRWSQLTLVLRVINDFTVRVRDNGVCLLLRRLCCVLVMSRD